MANLPNKPWSEGDTFTNDNTGVEYTFDGVKWLASGGEELDLSAFVTDAELAQVNEASEFRDDALNVKIEDESNQNTAAHAVFTAGIADHEGRITELEKVPEPEPQPEPEPEPELEGTLRWVDYTYNSDTIDALVATIRVHTDRTKMSLNWDTIDDGRKDWANLINDSVGLEVDGNIYWAMVEYVGDAGTSGRGKNFKILDHNIPPAGEIADQSVTGIWPNYEPSISYATTEYVDAGDQALQAQIDGIEIPEPAKQMFSTTVFGTASNSDNLSNGDWHFTLSDGQSTVVGDNAEGLVYKVNTRDWWKDQCELTGLGYVVVSSKDGFVYWGGHVKDGEFNERGELVLDLPRSQRQTSGGTATLGTTCRIEFYNVFREL